MPKTQSAIMLFRSRVTLTLAGIVGIIVANLVSAAFAADPYSVYVVDDAMHARCGPSNDYYRTDRLRHGQSLEVYVETEDGWLGIQPPPESFDWVPADAITIEPGGETGVVDEDKLVAWIGTHLGRARKYAWQVQLFKGEIVAILNTAQREGPDGPQTWLQIVPPSGEYRWIHRDDVVTDSAELIERVKSIAADNRAAADALVAASAESIAPAKRTAMEQPARRPRHAVEVAQSGRSVLESMPESQPSKREPTLAPERVETEPSSVEAVGSGLKKYFGNLRLKRPASADTHDDFATEDQWASSAAPADPPSAGAAGAALPVQTMTPITSIISLSAPRIAATPAPSTGANFGTANAFDSGVKPVGYLASNRDAAVTVSRARVDELTAEVTAADAVGLQLLLSDLMTRKATSIEVETLLARLQSDVAAGVGDPSLVNRASEYLALSRRRESVPPVVVGEPARLPIAATASASIATASLNLEVVPAPSAAPAVDRSHTSVAGQLLQVHSIRPGSPPFAIIDEIGRTLCYATPVPGVNLRRYLNSQIEIVGNEEQLVGLSTPNIRVSSVIRR